MATLSLVELLLRNAYEHGWIAVPAASALGLSVYHILQPHLPDFDTSQKAVLSQVLLTFSAASTNLCGPLWVHTV